MGSNDALENLLEAQLGLMLLVWDHHKTRDCKRSHRILRPLIFAILRWPLDHKTSQSTSVDNVTLEDVVALAGEDHDALVEVVVLHGGGGVQDRQRRVRLM